MTDYEHFKNYVRKDFKKQGITFMIFGKFVIGLLLCIIFLLLNYNLYAMLVATGSLFWCWGLFQGYLKALSEEYHE